uniref:[histone H3]-trimethyl-L-lysine(27) demethylase n=1 Tax=Phallusia mammillata TaxID=59560 RepID=A0A6F9DWN5_9ASCI|nr:histone demethylase UTY-like [Phallusia mammillata]
MSNNSLDDSTLADAELLEIEKYDSCVFGELASVEDDQKRQLIKKGIKHYEKLTTGNLNPDPLYFCKLGHLHLLVEDFHKSLSAYNKFYLLQKEYWKDSPFLFGLGIVYYHFSAYSWTVKLFQQLLYNDPGFSKANEVHCRLGLVFKITGNNHSAIKHFNRSLSDCRNCSITKPEIRFHLGHLYEIQGKYAEARREYDQIIALQPSTQVLPFILANTLRQLGWMFHTVEEFGDLSNRSATALQFLQRSIEIDPNNGQTWYFLGRYYSSMGKVHDAFVSYRQSIDKSEASADTWCSIGVLYQEQNQPMDALQAYICAVQLDRSHEAAWRDLAILYEACQQPRDALVCYLNSQHCLKMKNERAGEDNTDLSNRIKTLQQQVGALNTDQLNKGRVLPCIEDAWTLPIPAELTQRQSAFKCPPSKHKRPASASNQQNITSSHQPLTSHQTQAGESSLSATDPASLPGSTKTTSMQDSVHRTLPTTTSLSSVKHSTKRRKVDCSMDSWQPPPWYLTAQQIQVLQNLRLNQSILTPQQLMELERLEHNFSVMSKHQKAVKEEVEKQRALSAATQRNSATPVYNNLPVATCASALPGNMATVPVNGNHASPPATVSLPTEHTVVSPVLASAPALLSTNLHNGDIHMEKDDAFSVKAHIRKSNPDFSCPTSIVMNGIDGITMTHNSVPIHCNKLTTTSSQSHVESNTNCFQKAPLGEESKGLCVKSTQEENQVVRMDDGSGRYNSVMDTPQDTPSSDSGLTVPAATHPQQLQAKLTNHIQQMAVHNGTSIISSKPSPPSSLTSRNSALDGVLSPPGVAASTEPEQLSIKAESRESHSTDSDPLEQQMYELSSIKGRPLPSLLRPFGVTENTPAREVITNCRKLTSNGSSSAKHLFLDKFPPPALPKRQTFEIPKEKLCPPAPTIYLESKKEAMSRALADFCTNPRNPVTVIRGLAAALKLDLGLFSTKTLVESNPECSVEVRTQAQQPSEENWDPTGTTKVWRCESSRSFSCIAKYAQYQATTFQESLKEEEMKRQGQSTGSETKRSTSDSSDKGSGPKKRTFKTIKFGTNIDLSNEKKWRPQLQELSKLPWLFRLVSAGNMLSHVGHNILGMNTIQLYMKVPGSRTPGHQENNNYSAININIGPGDCEWFAVPEEYWGEIHLLCEKNNINYLSGSWWPVLEDLYHANIPVYRFIQKPGDLVWLNSGTVHWVQAVGWCNNIAWNVGLVSAYQYQMSIERYEWNKFSGYKSIVPLIQLTWSMAKHVRVADPKLFIMMKTCMMRTLWQCQNVLDHLKRNNVEVLWHGRNDNEPSHYCETCEVEVFNILYVRRSENNLQQHLVHCLECARNLNPDLENFVILNQFHTDELMRIYDQFSLAKKGKT